MYEIQLYACKSPLYRPLPHFQEISYFYNLVFHSKTIAMDPSQNDEFIKPKVEADKDENEKVTVPSQDHPSTSVDPAAKDPATPKPSGPKKRKLEVISDPTMKKKCRNSEVKPEFKEELSEVTMQEKEAIVNESEALRKENARLKLLLNQYIQQSKIGMQECDLLTPDLY